MEYPKARDGMRESKSVEEVQGVLEWVIEGREGRDSVIEGR